MNPDAPSFVPKHAAAPTTAAPASAATSSTHVYLLNLHRLVTDDELSNVATSITSFAPVRASVVFIGPKSSGCAELVYETAEIAAKAAELLDGKTIRSLVIHASQIPFTAQELQPRRQAAKKLAPYTEELGYVQQQFGDGFAWVQVQPGFYFEQYSY